jgi:anaerobic selenocysteine-containing dehydrogenase
LIPLWPERAFRHPDRRCVLFRYTLGGDKAFIGVVIKHLIEQGWIDESFIAAKTAGYDDLRAALEPIPGSCWKRLRLDSEEMLRFAR